MGDRPIIILRTCTSTLSPHVRTATNSDCLTGHVLARIRGKKNRDPFEVVRLPKSPHRRCRFRVTFCFGVVRIRPGQIAFTRTPFGPYSNAKFRTNAISASLEIAYVPKASEPAKAPVLDVIIMDPRPDATISGATSHCLIHSSAARHAAP